MSWRTTAAGIIGAVIAVAHAVLTPTPDTITAAIASVAAAIGLYHAADKQNVR